MFKNFKQADDYSCGPAALSFLLGLQGYNFLTQSKMRRECKPHPSFGTPAAIIEAVLHAKGIEYEVFENDPDRLYAPSLCNVTLDGPGAGHWVVVTAVTREMVCFFDPSSGRIRCIHRIDFNDHWFSAQGRTHHYMLLIK